MYSLLRGFMANLADRKGSAFMPKAHPPACRFGPCSCPAGNGLGGYFLVCLGHRRGLGGSNPGAKLWPAGVRPALDKSSGSKAVSDVTQMSIARKMYFTVLRRCEPGVPLAFREEFADFETPTSQVWSNQFAACSSKRILLALLASLRLGRLPAV